MRHDGDMSLGCQQKRLLPQRRVTGESGAIHRLALSLAPEKRFGTGFPGERIFHIGSAMKAFEAIRAPDGPIAQLDRVADFYSAGCRFESCWDRHC